MPHSHSSTPGQPMDQPVEPHTGKELGNDNRQQKRHSDVSLSPTESDSESAQGESDGENRENEMELARTKSIAETLSLPREIIFVAIVCSAQLLTRKAHISFRHAIWAGRHVANTMQKPVLEMYKPLFIKSATTLEYLTQICHGSSQVTLSRSARLFSPLVASVMSSATNPCSSSASFGWLYGPLSSDVRPTPITPSSLSPASFRALDLLSCCRMALPYLVRLILLVVGKPWCSPYSGRVRLRAVSLAVLLRDFSC